MRQYLTSYRCRRHISMRFQPRLCIASDYAHCSYQRPRCLEDSGQDLITTKPLPSSAITPARCYTLRRSWSAWSPGSGAASSRCQVAELIPWFIEIEKIPYISEATGSDKLVADLSLLSWLCGRMDLCPRCSRLSEETRKLFDQYPHTFITYGMPFITNPVCVV